MRWRPRLFAARVAVVERHLPRGQGQVGAARVMEHYGRQHYQQLGRAGGRKLKEMHGAEYFAAIGRMGGEKKTAQTG